MCGEKNPFMYRYINICLCVRVPRSINSMSNHLPRSTKEAHRWVVCRVYKGEPEVTIQGHLHPPECCYIRSLLPKSPRKPWNLLLPRAFLYRPVDKQNIQLKLDFNWSSLTLKRGRESTFRTSGLTCFSKAGSDNGAGMSHRCAGSKYEPTPCCSISLWDPDRFRHCGISPDSSRLPSQTELTRCDTANTTWSRGATVSAEGLFFLENNRAFSIPLNCILSHMAKL